MDIFELIVPEMAGVGLVMYEILEVELIIGYPIFHLEGGHGENKQSIGSAEVVVPEYIPSASEHGS